MTKDIKPIVLLLSAQCMINLGEVEDPILKKVNEKLDGAKVFIELLDILQEKTQGNLNKSEEDFLTDIIKNLKIVYNKKIQGK